MNKLHLVLSLLFAGNCFASQSSEVDSVKESVAQVQPEKICPNALGCQTYKESVRRYNEIYNTNIPLAEKDEVTDPVLLQEIKDVVRKIEFKDIAGNLIVPAINPKSKKLCLPFNQIECEDYAIARIIVDLYEKQDSLPASLGLVKQFDAMKKGQIYCMACKSTDKPNVRHIKQNRKK